MTKVISEEIIGYEDYEGIDEKISKNTKQNNSVYRKSLDTKSFRMLKY